MTKDLLETDDSYQGEWANLIFRMHVSSEN